MAKAAKRNDFETMLARATDPGYWKRLSPRLTIEGKRAASDGEVIVPDPVLAQRMQREGYCQTPPVLAPGQVKQIRDLMFRVEKAGWVSAFSFLYDETWLLAHTEPVRRVLTSVLGAGYKQIPDSWSYHVRAEYKAHGYRPHRELSEREMLLSSEMPKSVTIWIPLTDATPENGCMYVVPAHLELTKKDEEELPRKYGVSGSLGAWLHRVRALPAKAGSVLCWNHYLLHWGSYSSSKAKEDRLSVAYEFIRGDLDPAFHKHTLLPTMNEHTLVDPDASLPTFAQRLFIVARGLQTYLPKTLENERFHRLAQAIIAPGFPHGGDAMIYSSQARQKMVVGF